MVMILPTRKDIQLFDEFETLAHLLIIEPKPVSEERHREIAAFAKMSARNNEAGRVRRADSDARDSIDKSATLGHGASTYEFCESRGD